MLDFYELKRRDKTMIDWAAKGQALTKQN